MITVLIASFAAFVAGFVDALAGGGGIITFPVLIYLNLPISEIVGTNKLVSAFGTAFAAYTFYRGGHSQIEILMKAAPYTAVGSLLGALAVLMIPNDFLKPFVSVLIVIVALYCFFKPALGHTHSFNGLTLRTLVLTRIAALLLGFYDGFFGPGTGIFLTFLMITGLRCDFLSATANTKVLNAISNFVPLFVFLSHSAIRFDIGVPMLIANLLGGFIGAKTAIKSGSSFIRWIFLLMAVLMTLKSFF